MTSENKKIQEKIAKVKTSKNWSKLLVDQQEELSNQMSSLVIENKQGLEGIKSILNSNYTINNTLEVVREQEQEYLKAKPVPTPKPGAGKKVAKDLSKFSKTIANEQQLDTLITELDSTRGELNAGNEIEINW